MSHMPCVTVVVPCMNRSHLLRPTIDSILNQDYPNIECIVVDAGSKDGTVEILKSYGDRIRWVSEPDKGHADAINKGWRLGRGEIVAWLNADDIYEAPGGVRHAVDFLIAHPDVDLVYGDCGNIDINGHMTGMSYLRQWDLAYAVEHCDHCIPQPAAFLRRTIVEKVGWVDLSFIQKKDHELWLRVALAGKISHLAKLVAHARDFEGLSFDGRTAAPACLQVTRRFFELPGVPASIRRRRRRAMSNSCLRAIDYAWAGGRHWSLVIGFAVRAAAYDPSNAFRAVGRVMNCLRSIGSDGVGPRWLFWLVRLLGFPLMCRALAKTWFTRPAPRNLTGDRDVEWSYVAAHMPDPPRPGASRALDFGNGGGPLGFIAAERGYRVTSIDLTEVRWPYIHPRLTFIRGDLLKLPLEENSFDLVVNCSTVEHVGLPGRYEIAAEQEKANGDLEAMRRLWRLLRPGGVMVLTIPVGVDSLHLPMCRVYGARRLPQLIEGFEVIHENYWIKSNRSQWVVVTRDQALSESVAAANQYPWQNYYALGCLTLRKQ